MARLELVDALRRKREATPATRRAAEQRESYGDATTEDEVREEVVGLLRNLVTNMKVDNFVVRPHRRYVEKYSKAEAWAQLTPDEQHELVEKLAGLPTELRDEDEEAKRFDLLILRIEIAVLRGDQTFQKLRDEVRAIAIVLEAQSSIPLINENLALIQEIQSSEYWQDITVPMLEVIRKRLRSLIKLIEKTKRQIIYTDFEDQMGKEVAVTLPGFGAGLDYARFKSKARQFLREHEQLESIRKLQANLPMTPTDLEELERVMVQAGVGTFDDIERAKQSSSGLGLFIRSLIGLDREAAKQEFTDFLSDRSAAANQIEFVNLNIDHLTEHGVMDPGLLYESPFTDLSPTGTEDLLGQAMVESIVQILRSIRERALV